MTVNVLEREPTIDADAERWSLRVERARDAALARSAFRAYLERTGDRRHDVDAAEAIFGELVGNCAAHAPGAIAIEFTWHDGVLAVTDGCDRLRTWPFSPTDTAADTTHYGYAILAALGERVHVSRVEGGTRVAVRLGIAR